MVMVRGCKTILREFRAEDLDASMSIVGDDRVTRWLSFDSLTREQQQARLARTIQNSQKSDRDEYYLAVIGGPGNDLIGFVRLGLSNLHAAKLGYAIAADHQGHGYATDAVETLINFGFQELRLHRITAAIGPDNTASIAVVNRLRFLPEGRLRDHVHTNGEWRDSLLFSRLTNERP